MGSQELDGLATGDGDVLATGSGLQTLVQALYGCSLNLSSSSGHLSVRALYGFGNPCATDPARRLHQIDEPVATPRLQNDGMPARCPAFRFRADSSRNRGCSVRAVMNSCAKCAAAWPDLLIQSSHISAGQFEGRQCGYQWLEARARKRPWRSTSCWNLAGPNLLTIDDLCR